jgi:hypothetical protein
VRSPLLLGAAVLLLLIAGCGGSSTGKSTGVSVAGATQRSRSAPARQSSTAASAGSAPSTSAAHGVVEGSSGTVAATLHADTHHPKVGRPWPIYFTVTRAGHPARASVSYEYLFGGQVVARRSHYNFTGRFSDIFKWPASAVGYPLTFRAVIVSEGATINLDYPVQVVA